MVEPWRRFLHLEDWNWVAAPLESELPPSCALCAQLPCSGIAACFCSSLDYSGLMVGFLFGLILILVMLGKHHSASTAQLHLFKLRPLPPFPRTRIIREWCVKLTVGSGSFCNTRDPTSRMCGVRIHDRGLGLHAAPAPSICCSGHWALGSCAALFRQYHCGAFVF